MKITSRSRHALRLMIEVARRSGADPPVRLRDVALATGLSKKFLEQLALALKSHGLLRGISGRNGGYVLTRPPASITIGNVLEATMGPFHLTSCLADSEHCMFSDMCECRMIWLLLRKRIRDVLEEFTLADVSDQDWVEAIRVRLGLDEEAVGEFAGA